MARQKGQNPEWLGPEPQQDAAFPEFPHSQVDGEITKAQDPVWRELQGCGHAHHFKQEYPCRASPTRQLLAVARLLTNADTNGWTITSR